MKVFISHNSYDKPFVRRLADALQTRGIQSWVDEAEVLYGQSLIHTIADAIHSIDTVLAVISSDSVYSPWVRKELSLALTKEINLRRVTVIPLVIDHCDLPFYLTDKLYADFRDDTLFDSTCDRLAKSIEWHRATPSCATTSILHAGNSAAINYRPSAVAFVIEFILLLLLTILALVTWYAGKLEGIDPAHHRFASAVYIFCGLLVFTRIVSIANLIILRVIMERDANFGIDIGSITLGGLLNRRYRGVVWRYRHYSLVKLSFFLEASNLTIILLVLSIILQAVVQTLGTSIAN